MNSDFSKILICGLRCTGKTTLMWNLQKTLNWPMFSVSQFLRDYIRSTGLQAKGENVLDNYDRLMGEEIDQRTVNLLSSDHSVIVETRAFRFISEPWPGTLKILLVAQPYRRIQRSSFREGIDTTKAKKRLEKKEGEWRNKIDQQFGRTDYFNRKHYDLVLDTTQMTRQMVVREVLKKVDSK